MAKMSELPDDIVVVSAKEYTQLKNNSVLLDCLLAHGVDNWDWYGDALEAFEAHPGRVEYE